MKNSENILLTSNIERPIFNVESLLATPLLQAEAGTQNPEPLNPEPWEKRPARKM